MTPTPPLTPLSADERPVYAVAGGNHVTLLLDRESTSSAFDVIDVVAQPGAARRPIAMPSASGSTWDRAN